MRGVHEGASSFCSLGKNAGAGLQQRRMQRAAACAAMKQLSAGQPPWQSDVHCPDRYSRGGSPHQVGIGRDTEAGRAMAHEQGETGSQVGRRGVARNVPPLSEQRHRVLIYRAALARMRAERDGGSPPVRAAWHAACTVATAFDLDTRASGLLIGCAVTAVIEG